MSDPATAGTACPNGHVSSDRAWCTVCGTPIAGPVLSASDTGSTPAAVSMPLTAPFGSPPVPAGMAAAAGPAPFGGGGVASASAGVCPNCSALLDDGLRFCEVCGYDPATGSLPEAPVARPAAYPAPAPAREPSYDSGYDQGASGPTDPFGPPGRGFDTSYPPLSQGSAGGTAAPEGALVAVITADRAYYESHMMGEVDFPLGMPARTIELQSTQVSIGRRSRSRGTNPALDLAGPPEDPAVSHTHASLLQSPDGTWSLVDHGSTNGTYLNEEPDALPANQPVPVRPGDRIYVGAWTRITLELR
jgi:hypothetical protein